MANITLKMNDILNVITDLSHSQGFYGRLLKQIYEIRDNDPDAYDELCEQLEAQEFRTSLDVVLFFEQ